MNRVCLCVDVGNSHTVVGVFRGTEVVESWRLTTRQPTTSDEVFLRLRGLIVTSTVPAKDISFIGLATVVPALERPWLKAMKKLFNLDGVVVTHDNCLNLSISYEHPQQLGTDRICNVLALREEGYQRAVVLDLGTATTFDILGDGGFYGGVILPGISSTLEVLTEKAVQLPAVSLSWTEDVIANNTEDALRSGVLHGFVGQLEIILEKIRKEMGPGDLPVLATGGWYNLLMNRFDQVDRFDPFLTLRGIRAVALESKESRK